MNKQQFKKAFSTYRKLLSNGQLEHQFVKRFNWLFGVPQDRVAFISSGCDYSFQFAWIYSKKSNYRSHADVWKMERIVNRNKELINW